VAAHERECVTDILRAASATDAVHIIFRMLGHIIIDNVADSGDVEPAGCDVRRNHHLVFAALEAFERFDPFTLRPIRM